VTNPPNRPSRPIKAITEPAKPPKPAAATRPTGSARPARPSGAQAAFGAEEIEKQLAIRDVMDYAVRVTRAVQLAKQMESYRGRPMVLALIAIPSLIVFLYAYAARPDWVFGPDPVRIAPAQQMAYTRFAMYLASQRVETYRTRTGVLPGSLAEMDEDWPGMSYRALSPTVFELAARGDSGEIVFQSDQPVRGFLGNSAAFLRSREP
jgi:hypothetical protein